MCPWTAGFVSVEETMNVGVEIARQLEMAATGAPWHGEPLSEVLDGIDLAVATARPIAGAHTIWELVLHLISIQRLVLARCSGERAPFVEEESWSASGPASPDEWCDACACLLDGEEKTAAAARAFTEESLDAPVAKDSDRGVDLLLGHLQHGLYHTGQIALLRKAAEA